MSEASSSNISISFLVGHDANAFIRSNDGQWGYENSERVDGIKQSSDYQVAVDKLMKRMGVKNNDVVLLSLTTTQGASLPILNEKKFKLIEWKKHKYIVPLLNKFRRKMERKDSKYIAYSESVENSFAPCIRVDSLKDFNNITSGKIDIKVTDLIVEGIAEFYGRRVRCFHVEHHLAHICSAFLRQKHANVCISMDGASHSPYRLRQFPFWGGFSAARDGEDFIISPPSFFAGGILYSAAASFLGLTEGKLMGLAGHFSLNEYADKQHLESWNRLMFEMESIYDLKSSLSSSDIEDIKSQDVQCRKKLYSILQEIGQLHSELHSSNAEFESMPKPAHILIAASVQKVFESMRRQTVKSEIEFFRGKGVKIDGIVFTGGCTLNCPSNKLLVEEYPDTPLIFDNACNDEGLSLGVDYAVNISGLSKRFDMKKSIDTPFIGSHVEFLDEAKELARALGFNVIEFTDPSNIVCKISNAIASMNIIILCHGRYESGPRALGNRSLIGNASSRVTHDELNYIKRREELEANCSDGKKC